MLEKKKVEDNAKAILKQYENVRSYKNTMGFEKDWNTYIDFVEDRQWERTDKNENIPKPQHNIVKMTKRSKTSAISSDTIKIVFSPLEIVEGDIANEAAKMFNDAIIETNDDIDQESLDSEVVDDAFTLGTGFSYYFWNSNVNGGYKTKFIGNIDGQCLDPMNVFPGNPQCRDKDKQPFWILTTREMVESIKKEAKDNKIAAAQIELIVADKDTSQEQYQAAKNEVLGEDKTTVYVKLWRDLEDNKIYFEKATKGCLFKPKTLVWDYDGDDIEPYPIAVLNWETRKKSIFGIGEAEGMIYNQKAINFTSAMQILNVQDTAWSKYIVKFDALKKQMQNIPGEIVNDESNQPGDNIKAMQPAMMSNQAFQLLDNMITNTRTFNGVTESVTGESMGANMAAAAIIALQNQAKVPLDGNRKKVIRYHKQVARIKEMFFKCKFNTPRVIRVKNDDGTEGNASFTGTDYKEIPLRLKIDVGVGSSYSESLAVATLDRFLDKGWITPVQYADLCPDNVMPFKEQFKKMKEIEKADQLKQAEKAMQQQADLIKTLKQQVLDHRNALQRFNEPAMPKEKPMVGGNQNG